MKISKVVTLTGILMLTACSSSSSLTTVNEIRDMPVPVVHAQNNPTADTTAVNNCYKENATRLSELQYTLKTNMGDDVKTSEVFDTKSDAHRVFTALSKLEQISAMNETYRKEGNIAGLKAINEMLKPLKATA
ncbi:hypothetical protein SIL08_09815 [Scandinavium sp. V105_16]|uniref:Lipoprotein n=1 Tax=Scandinavium lactucae TaxID=3095028 RepID=A0AAJ2S650_9ENTR|nr:MULTISPECIES: hypothetical protein [unclassified Scandinavium]MDX6020567.1 hypothetical protein [Scandinavium sp. V105_16]MDX6030787.1 hypothetical protein [Scandinavium sp. V105_12]MDX6040842.1 hypothetical protein [Scandinavium sp. V105_6]MDX6051746.1 hypothetical protein [Scandinavium sp. V105_1]